MSTEESAPAWLREWKVPGNWASRSRSGRSRNGSAGEMRQERPRNHRAITFTDLTEFPNQSSGYITVTPNDSFRATKDKNGVWYDEHRRFAPKETWVFTSHSGPANDAAFRELVRDELRGEQLGLSADLRARQRRRDTDLPHGPNPRRRPAQRIRRRLERRLRNPAGQPAAVRGQRPTRLHSIHRHPVARSHRVALLSGRTPPDPNPFPRKEKR